jgi:uncharacterized OB-fold protein
MSRRPLPVPTAETRAFWDGCAQGELRYQACEACGTVQPIPRSCCQHCQSAALQWRRSAGRGRILSHTTVHRAPTPAFRREQPYVIAIVDLDEGFRLMVNLAGGEQPGLAVGAAVRIGFVTVDGVALPQAELLP